ncbi:Exosome complex exonuclease RRP44 [Folsomia candida]|uniref:Protein DIS3 homolog n=1 Tax=Folsomia candida TaxID=158441 RepID=A0A226E1T5_FOLCA|nr:Exosome complex exonuclease RRP44 [Folsomia candida]
MYSAMEYGYGMRKRPVEEVTFYRQNKKGKPLKISREKYLRTDICCGVNGCKKCIATDRSLCRLEIAPAINSKKFDFKHFILPDAGFIIRQTDVLDDLDNVILLQSVMEEVYKRNVTKYKRIRNGVKTKSWTYFLNEHSKDTFVNRKPNETTDERNTREFVQCYKYFTEHLASFGIKVIIFSDNPAFREEVEKIHGGDVLLASAEEYKYQDFTYPPHFDSNLLQAGIKSGKYYQGAFRSFNFFEGFVRIEDDASAANAKSGPRKQKDDLAYNEILLQGLENVNRACEGDIVVIEVLPEDKWSIPSGMVTVDAIEKESPLVADKVVLENVETDVDVQEHEDRLEEEEIFAAVAESVKNVGEKKRQRTGRVIGIIRRKWLPICGMIRKSLKEGTSFHYFFPDNKKMPKVRIETRNVDRFEGQKIVAQIDQWPISSRFPVGHYIKILGPAGTIETETSAILHEHGIPHDPFSKAVEACLPQMPWTIDPSEYAKRKDFRDIIVCSVDPPGCTDIDDALHCRRLDDGMYEVGVHIADVSYFVQPNNALDDEAAKRGTTVYLADRRIDMIPPLISSNLASLHSGTDKLVFSCIWTMTPSADILDTKFYKGIMNSKSAMTYAEAQARLNSKTTGDPITDSLRGLSTLAQILKKKRFDNGALMLSASEVNEEGEIEDDCEESHSLVEEFMLLANCSVAKFTLETFREFSLLRRHPIPPPANFEPLQLAAKAHGIKIVVDEGSKALNESLERQPAELKSILRVLTTRCMTQALYCCSGTTPPDEYPHFGLAAKLYTHFTSPIRRYADLMVHRLLAIAIEVDRPNPRILDSQRMHGIAENINLRHRMAQYASRASYNIHKSKTLKGKNEEEHTGFVLFVKRNALQDGEITIGSTKFRSLDRLTIGLSLEEEKDRVVFRLLKPEVAGLSDKPASSTK